jgi:hypothetical protein
MKDLKHIELASKEREPSIPVSEIEAIIKYNVPDVALARIKALAESKS